MADNFISNPGAGGSTFAADDIGLILYPRSKITIGIDGVNDGDVSAANPMPVTLNATGPSVISTNAISTNILARIPAQVGGRTPVDGSGVTQPVAGTRLNNGTATVAGSFHLTVGGSDGTNLRPLLVDTSGRLNVSTGLVSTINSTAVVLGISGVYTGASEDVTDYADVRVSVFADQLSAVDGLQIQQSSNGTSWDISDNYTIPAGTGKTFSVGVSAKFFRVVYTNGATAQAAFRLQTKYQKSYTKGSSVRPQDGRGNDNDMEEQTSHLMGYTGVSWDRVRASIANGLAVDVTRISGALPAGANSIGAVTGAFFQATQPVSAVSLPLPTGAATETTLAALNTKVTAVNTGAVVLAAGAAIAGKFGIDQTTPGTTNAVAVTGYPAAAASADGFANPTVTKVDATMLTFNGASWDRVRGMSTALTTGDTGAKIATGNGANVTSVGNKGVQILVNMGVVSGTTPTAVLKVQGSTDAGTSWYDIPGATTATLVATGLYGITVYPGIAVTAGVATTGTTATANMVIPRTWRLVWTIGGTTPSFTITNIQYIYLPN